MSNKRIKADLRRLKVRPSKRRGQNFVVDASVIRQIVQFGRPAQAGSLVEIGPGLGALTQELSTFGVLTVIEIEKAFCEELASKFPRIKIINEDVRQVDFSRLGQNLTVFGNLPYAFSSEIVFKLVEFAAQIDRAVLLLQREFAERMAASAEGREFGTLSVSCQLVADLLLGPIIPGESFQPSAKVESRIVEMKFHRPQRHTDEERRWIRRVVLAAFYQRRRKLLNSMRASGIAPDVVLREALKAAEIDPNIRAERVTVQSYIGLARVLRDLLAGQR